MNNIEKRIPDIAYDKDAFCKIKSKCYDDVAMCPIQFNGADVLNFTSNVVRKYSDYTLPNPTPEQAIEGMNFLLFDIIPKDDIIRIAFQNWLKVNKQKGLTTHINDIKRQLDYFYADMKNFVI